MHVVGFIIRICQDARSPGRQKKRKIYKTHTQKNTHTKTHTQKHTHTDNIFFLTNVEKST